MESIQGHFIYMCSPLVPEALQLTVAELSAEEDS